MRGQVSNVVSCAIGQRIEQPEFGISPLQFQNVPLNLRALSEQVARWVPNASYETIEEVIADEQERRVILEVSP